MRLEWSSIVVSNLDRTQDEPTFIYKKANSVTREEKGKEESSTIGKDEGIKREGRRLVGSFFFELDKLCSASAVPRPLGPDPPPPVLPRLLSREIRTQNEQHKTASW